jgi:hypothetical protein
MQLILRGSGYHHPDAERKFPENAGRGFHGKNFLPLFQAVIFIP